LIRGAPRALVAAGVVALTVWLGSAAPAAAGTEEFSTFSVEAQEEDDESLLDHLLTRPPRAWRDEWERAPQAIRTSQGCLTSGQWFIQTDLKLHAPLSGRARFGLDVRQDESDIVNFQYFDFWFRFPTRWGTPGFMFRPLFDKSRQDFAVFYELGADTASWLVQATFTFEDMFNNLWAFRQTRVGDLSEPYERHPYEPGLRLAARQPTWRAAAFGRYLTPSRKQVIGDATVGTFRRVTLWGTLAGAEAELQALGLEWELAGANRQARGTDTPESATQIAGHDFRRQWWTEAAIHRRFGSVMTELRGLYQSRSQDVGPPVGPRTFDAVDRVIQAEAVVPIQSWLQGRVGGLYDRISVRQSGTHLTFSYGSRTESRAYVGLMARVGRVSLHAVEGIELDPERYEVWWVHDKAFLHLQTTF
jgi:hypothetical protein